MEIGLMHSEMFMNSHFHFLTVVELATSEVLLQQPKIISCTLGAFSSVLDVLADVCTPPHGYIFIHADMLRSHFAIIVHLYQLTVSFVGGNVFH